MRKRLAEMNGYEAYMHYMHIAEKRWQKADRVHDDLAGLPMSREAHRALKDLADELDRKAKLYQTPGQHWQAQRALSNLDKYGMAAAAGWLRSCNWPVEDAERLLLDR